MRCVHGALVLLVAAAGCKNQSTSTFTNPFAADRVPPPSTRVLAPGTSQPYYPGEPMPTIAPPGSAQPATTLPGTTPPGGWGAVPAQSSTTPGDAVRVPGDQEQLRFATAPDSAPSVPAPSVPSATAFALGPPPPMRTPSPVVSPLTSGAATPQQLTAREVTQAEYLAGAYVPDVAPASATALSDGFRPQGSRPPAASEDDQAFRPPEIRRGAPAAGPAANFYGAAPNHEWLRGQLEYWPATGQWSLRYLAEGAPADGVGGRVLIDNPQALANLSPGELVMIQGQLFIQPNALGGQTPAYRVAAVQRQRQ